MGSISAKQGSGLLEVAMYRSWVVGLMLSSCFSAAAAQPQQTETGSRIRVTHTCHVNDDGSVRCDMGTSARQWSDTGLFVGMQGDTLLLESSQYKTPVRLPLSAIQRVEVRLGGGSRWKMGSTIGLLVGATTGGVISANHGSSGPNDIVPREAYVGAGIVLGAACGFAAGAITGSFFKTDRWVSQPIGALGLVALNTSPNAYAMSIRLRF